MNQDEVDVLISKIRKERAEVTERLAGGGCSTENVVGGYRDLTGYLRGLAKAEEIARDVFRGWLPPVPEPKRVEIKQY